MRACQDSPSSRTTASLLRITLLAMILMTLLPLARVAPAAAADDTATALTRINQARAAIGVPPLTRHAALDAAATAHADYYRLNFGDPALAGMGLHYEEPGKPGFTGVDFAARARAFGYNGSINEDIGLSGSMLVSLDWFMGTIYHRLTLLDPRYTDIGFGVVNDGQAKIEVIDLGTVVWRSTIEPAWEPWPAPDATGVGLRFDGEAPNPFPGATYPLGYPITLKYNGAGTVAFTGARLTQNGQQVPVRAQAGTGWITNNTYMIAATGPLQPGTTYTIAVEGTLNGGAFTRSWSFTTLGAGSIVVPETGRRLSGRFLSYWQANGGLPVFGYPLTEEFAEGGRTVQYFERQRFEHHPQHAAPYDVLLGLLGVADAERRGLTGSTPFRPLPAGTPSDANCDFVPETGHRLCWGFRAYWQRHGLEFGDPGVAYRESLALFGYPISEEFRMTLEDGREYTVQYFERARFEWHPQNQPPYDILQGRLAADQLGR